MARTGLYALTALLVGTLTRAGAPPRKYTETVTGKGGKKVTFQMVLIPGGAFTMGTPQDEEDRKDTEGPQHKVALDPFYMAAHEVSLALFQIYYAETVKPTRDDHDAQDKAAKDPGLPADDSKINNLDLARIYSVDALASPTPIYGDLTMGWGGGKRPAIGVTWLNAVNFCRWLRRKTGKPYRLPTEAEWEYACRAGSTSAYCFGEDPDALEDYAWFEDNSDEKTEPAGRKKPNKFGLYDMHGNVREWCHDFYDPAAYKTNAKTNPARNPLGPKQPPLPPGKKRLEIHERYHVVRGGSWDSPLEQLRSGYRDHERPSWRYKDPQYPKSRWWLPEMAFIGIRLVCPIKKDD